MKAKYVVLTTLAITAVSCNQSKTESDVKYEAVEKDSTWESCTEQKLDTFFQAKAETDPDSAKAYEFYECFKEKSEEVAIVDDESQSFSGPWGAYAKTINQCLIKVDGYVSNRFISSAVKTQEKQNLLCLKDDSLVGRYSVQDRETGDSANIYFFDNSNWKLAFFFDLEGDSEVVLIKGERATDTKVCRHKICVDNNNGYIRETQGN